MCVASLYDALQDAVLDAVLDSDLRLIGPVELDKLDRAEVADMADGLRAGDPETLERYQMWVDETWYDERGLAASDLVLDELDKLIAGELDQIEEAWLLLDEYDPDWLAIAESLALQHDQSDPGAELLALLGITTSHGG